MNTLIPLTHHAKIKIAKLVLQKQDHITWNDVDRLKVIMQEHLNTHMSPADIAKHYDICYSDFGMFLKRVLGLSLLSQKEGIRVHNKNIGRIRTDEKDIYRTACQFQFDPYLYPKIPGYNILLERNIYHPTNNPNGVCRDHIVSKEYGFRNEINPVILSHPANCQFLTNIDNLRKGSGSSLNIEQLLERISNWEQGKILTIDSNYKQLPKTEQHKQKIRETSLGYMYITNGCKNRRIPKNDEMPNDYWRGTTRRNKMVGDLGLEPRNEIF